MAGRPQNGKRTKRFRDLTGQKFGRLLVVQQIQRAASGHTFWGCVCECGNFSRVNGASLVRGHTKACGCMHAESCGLRFKKANGHRGKVLLYHRYQREAAERGYSWHLSADEFFGITERRCAYCNTAPVAFIGNVKANDPTYHGTYFYNGIDRVDPKQGYHPKNVVPCCRICNEAKLKKTAYEFAAWVRRVKSHIKTEIAIPPLPVPNINQRNGKRFPDGVGGKRLLLQVYKKRAKKFGREFSLTDAEFLYLTCQNCHYCGASPSNEIGSRKSDADFARTRYAYNSLDRKDSTQGYTRHNVVPACHECNIAKNTQTYDEFLTWVDKVSMQIDEVANVG